MEDEKLCQLLIARIERKDKIITVVIVVQVMWQDGIMVEAVIDMGYIRS